MSLGHSEKGNLLVTRVIDFNYQGHYVAATQWGARKTMSETTSGVNLVFPHSIAKINRKHSNQKNKGNTWGFRLPWSENMDNKASWRPMLVIEQLTPLRSEHQMTKTMKGTLIY